MKINMNAGSKLKRFRNSENNNLSKETQFIRIKEPKESLKVGLIRCKAQKYRNSIPRITGIYGGEPVITFHPMLLNFGVPYPRGR